uniref:E3 ubiquitin protein ligase n=1 Tax=Gossypium raimondii TaxID=29730 RepID=A0A0D2UDI0_GOSRA|nr:hypothetical protein B456_010G163100 [Gossypium raimondii]
MEHSRNQRLMLLLVKSELHFFFVWFPVKSKPESRGERAASAQISVLESKLACIGSMERSCLFLDQKIASQNFRISDLKSDIENIDTKYDSSSRKLKAVKSEIEEIEEVEKERVKFYELKISEMNEFRECEELKSTFMELPGNNGYMSSSEIAEAKMKRAELLAMKESLTKTLASNHQRRAELQK